MEPGRTIVVWIYQRVKQVKDESTPRGHRLSLPKNRRVPREDAGVNGLRFMPLTWGFARSSQETFQDFAKSVPSLQEP